MCANPIPQYRWLTIGNDIEAPKPGTKVGRNDYQFAADGARPSFNAGDSARL
jgi:hypothetical protein